MLSGGPGVPASLEFAQMENANSRFQVRCVLARWTRLKTVDDCPCGCCEENVSRDQGEDTVSRDHGHLLFEADTIGDRFQVFVEGVTVRKCSNVVPVSRVSQVIVSDASF